MKEKGILKIFTNVIIFSIVAIVGAVSFFNYDSIGKATIAPTTGGSINSGVVSIAFVVAGDEDVSEVLGILEKKDTTATFFVTGKWCTKNPEILSEIVAKNHEIGNHGYLNRDFSSLSYKESLDEIKTTERTIENLCGYRTTLFMPPKGKFSSSTTTSCAALGYKMVLWSRSAHGAVAEDIYKQATENILSGEIVLLSLNQPTVSVVSEIIDYYTECGLQIKSVSANISTK